MSDQSRALAANFADTSVSGTHVVDYSKATWTYVGEVLTTGRRTLKRWHVSADIRVHCPLTNQSVSTSASAWWSVGMERCDSLSASVYRIGTLTPQ